jgi:sugar (pentulose or hexulose) kinase
MQAVWALPKLLWLLRRRPTLVRGARLAMQTDFINRRLTGHDVATDLSTALKTGADLITEDWPHETMADLDVPDGLLPPLVRSGAPLGNVSNDAAEATGIPAGTPVFAGATDGCAAQLGAGVVDVGSWNSVLGTTLVLKGVTRELLHDPQGAVYSHKAPNGTWLPGGASSTGAGVIARDFASRDLDALENEARRHEDTDVVAYPLGADGERFPFVAPQARPFLLGTPRDDAEHYAAVLQGVAFIERLAYDHLDHLGAPLDGRIVLTGGATRSAYWCRLRADILGRPLDIPENAQPALGMAVLAAASGRDPAEAAARMVRVRETVDPRPGAGHDDAYLRLVGELESRGWLPPETAAHVQKRTTG